MSLIPLTGEFSNGIISFNGLPNFGNGFFRVLIFGSVVANRAASLVMEINGPETVHSYCNFTMPNGSSNPPLNAQIETGRFILLAQAPLGGNVTFNSEVILGLAPGGRLISARCNTAHLIDDGVGDIMYAYNWNIVGGCTGRQTLDSLVFKLRVNNSPSASATGTARLFPYPHVSGLQAEIS